MNLYRKNRPYLSKMMNVLGLDIAYIRGEGNYLYYRDENDEQQPVLDLLGGYGSLIFGHNHPKIIEEAKWLYDKQIPFHAQFSEGQPAGELAEELNQAVKREYGSHGDFVAVFGSTGSEAVEIALKHAAFERYVKLGKIQKRLNYNYEQAAKSARSGRAYISEDLLEHTSLREMTYGVEDIDQLLTLIKGYNEKQMRTCPVFIALRRSVHGKFLGRVQLTYSKQVAKPFLHLGLKTRFVSMNAPKDLERIEKEESRHVYDLEVRNGWVRLLKLPVPRLIAVIVEPLQGEGGMFELSRESGSAIRQFCSRIDIPLIIDEIQSGSGRTGRFLASTEIDLKGDYYILGQSLTGGVCKMAVALIKRKRYQEQFDVLHSSTFGEDAFSCGIALKVLDMLNADNGAVYRHVCERGRRLMARLQELKRSYPEAIKTVRGRGLMLGLEFHDPSQADSVMLRACSHDNVFGYLIACYLLKERGIRTLPTAEAPNVLRIQPAVSITDLEIDHLFAALEHVCKIIECQDAYHFFFPIMRGDEKKARTEIMDFRRSPVRDCELKQRSGTPRKKVAFMNHLITAEWLSDADPSLTMLTLEEKRRFIRKAEAFKISPMYPPVTITSVLGPSVQFTPFPLCVASEQMIQFHRSGNLECIRTDIEDRIQSAKQEGYEIIGLGMYTSIVTDNGTSLRVPGITLTTGNSLTTAYGIEAMEAAIEQGGRDLEAQTLVVVGGSGNIARTYASVFSELLNKIVLLGSNRAGSMNRLRRAAETIYDEGWLEIKENPDGNFRGITAKLRELKIVKDMLHDPNLVPECSVGSTIIEFLLDTYGEDPFCQLRTDLESVRMGDLVLAAANEDRPFLNSTHFKEGAIICDIGIPQNVVAGITEKREDLYYMLGGIVATPHGESLEPDSRMGLKEGQVFACMAEAMLMGLADISTHFSYGPISRRSVREIYQLAKIHGFKLAEFKTKASL